MNSIIEQVQETYKRFTTSCECEGLEVKTAFYGRPVHKKEIDRGSN